MACSVAFVLPYLTALSFFIVFRRSVDAYSFHFPSPSLPRAETAVFFRTADVTLNPPLPLFLPSSALLNWSLPTAPRCSFFLPGDSVSPSPLPFWLLLYGPLNLALWKRSARNAETAHPMPSLLFFFSTLRPEAYNGVLVTSIFSCRAPPFLPSLTLMFLENTRLSSPSLLGGFVPFRPPRGPLGANDVGRNSFFLFFW